jgi:chromosome segregation ATPase
MGKRTGLLVLGTSALVALAWALAPTGGHAQSAAPGDRGRNDALAAEVRLVRQAVDRLAAVTVKSQVLVARLAAQEQRLAREQDAIARAELAIDATTRRQERTRATLERASRALADVVQEPRAEARREVESLKADLEDQDRELSLLQARLAQAQQSLRSDHQAYSQLEAALDGLVRELERPGR